MTRLEAVLRETAVPEMVTGAAPGVMVWPSTTKPPPRLLGRAVRVSPAIARVGLPEGPAGRAMVLEPRMRFELESIETAVPEIVTPGPPGVIVVPSMEKPPACGVKTCPPTEKAEEEGRAIVLLPMTTFEAPSDTRVPETVIAGLPWVTPVPSIE